MSIFGYLIVGLIAGAIAKAILPGRQGGGWLATLILGVVGAFLGGLIGEFIFNKGLGGAFNLWTWILAIGGSILCLLIYGAVTGRKSTV